MAALTDGAKRFIVQALACFDSPQQVADSVKKEFGVEVHRAQVAQYDPTKASGAKLSTKWRVLFADTRERFRKESAEIPIASQAFRLRVLQRMLAKVEARGNAAMAAQLLEQAAEEVGEVFVNRRLDAPKAPGSEEAMPAAEYILSPDEHVSESPIL